MRSDGNDGVRTYDGDNDDRIIDDESEYGVEYECEYDDGNDDEDAYFVVVRDDGDDGDGGDGGEW